MADFQRLLRHPKAVSVALGLQVIGLPLACYAIVVGFGLPPVFAIGLMLLAASPGGISANLFSHLFGGNVAMNISLTAVNTALSIVTLPLIANWSIDRFASSGQVVPLQTGKLVEVIAIVLVPVLLGMFVASRRPGFAARMEKPVKIFSALVLAVVAVLAIAKEWSSLSTAFAQIGPAVVLFNLVSLLAGYYLSRAAGLDKPLATAISYEIGIHNSTLAIFVALSVLGSYPARAAGRDLFGGDVHHRTALRLGGAPAQQGARARVHCRPVQTLIALTADRQLRFLRFLQGLPTRRRHGAVRAPPGDIDMQITGMLHGARLLDSRAFPPPRCSGPAASEEEIKALIDKHGLVFIKPVFKGGIGKKGKAGLLGRANDLKTALAEKERLYFAEHHGRPRQGQGQRRDLRGRRAGRARGLLLDQRLHALPRADDDAHAHGRHGHRGARQEPGRAWCPFDPLTGLKAFVVANALTEIGAPKEIISPLVQQLPKLWELFHDFGMTTLELNPIRMREDKKGRLTPVACDFKCGFDRDDPRWLRLDLPPHLFAADYSDFEQEINTLRTHQGQSDVYVINDKGTMLAPTFGGGANSLVTEMLGDDAIISSDFGGNPPYEKMKEVARICFKHWLRQANVLFIIGGKSNNTDIFETFRAMADALREHFSAARADAALRGGRPRRAEPGARHGRAARHLRRAGPALPPLRLRLRHERGDPVRQEDRRAG